MSWRFFKAEEFFRQFRTDWDTLNRRHSNHLLLDSRFVEPALRHFGSKDTVLAINKDGPNSGMALLTKTGTGQWSTFQPSQAPLGMIVFGGDDQNCEGLLGLLATLPGYSLILSVLQQDPLHTSFGATSTNPNIEIVQYIETPQLKLVASFEEYWESRSRNLKHNLDRQSRRSVEQGSTLELVTLRQHSQIEAGIREYGRLESAGWKAEAGTAICEDNVQGSFYREMLENFSENGEAVIFQLVLDGKVVASDLCLSRAGTLVVLKTAYDEKVQKLSPALLMRREIIKHLYAEGRIQNIEFYGRVLPWHTQWMTGTRGMFHINLFRNRYVMPTRELIRTLKAAFEQDKRVAMLRDSGSLL
jgi:hypothetical protein